MDLVLRIKQKKELSDIPDSLVEETLNKILKKNNLSFIPEKEKQQKHIIKEVRAELRKYTGRFQVNSRKRERMLHEDDINKLLSTHTSTRERIDIYSELIDMIKKYVSTPRSILDLGCGLNPLIFVKDFPNSYYYAYDIKAKEIDLINRFFKKQGIDGKAEVIDIRKIDNFPKTDICLIFKTLDIIETKGHKYAHEIMQKVNSKYIVVSFSTRTLSGKPMKGSRRLWFESILKALNLLYKIELFDNEIFYFIEKRPHQ